MPLVLCHLCYATCVMPLAPLFCICISIFLYWKFSGSIKYSSAEIYITRVGGGNVVTTIGSNVTLEWSCRVRGNHSVGMLAWSLKLHTVTDRTRIAWLYYRPEKFWIGITKSIHYGRRVRWTGEASQGKISFVIQDVRISDAQSYKLSWKVILPSRNGSRQVVMTQSKLMVTVAGNYWYNIKAR